METDERKKKSWWWYYVNQKSRAAAVNFFFSSIQWCLSLDATPHRRNNDRKTFHLAVFIMARLTFFSVQLDYVLLFPWLSGHNFFFLTATIRKK